MATYIRRKLAKLMVKDDTPPSLTISRPEGAVVFTKKEQQRYTWLLQMLDSDSDEQLGGAEGAMFLRRSQLTTDQLREVWRLASGGTSKARLTKEDWLIACKLVAAVQHKGLEPSMAAITGVDPLPIADFHYDNDPDVEADGAAAAAIPDGAIRVRLLNPTAYGSGLAKHVRYNVVTSTTLGHFPRREMSVWRRYSDFEWLHSRLTITFPAAMIPLFPEKRVVGNTDDSFVAERQAGLEAYVQRVAAHPVLSTSADLLVFLDGTDTGLEAARSYIEAIAREEADSLLAKAGDLVSSMTSRGDEAKLSLKTDEAYVAVSQLPGSPAQQHRYQHKHQDLTLSAAMHAFLPFLVPMSFDHSACSARSARSALSALSAKCRAWLLTLRRWRVLHRLSRLAVRWMLLPVTAPTTLPRSAAHFCPWLTTSADTHPPARPPQLLLQPQPPPLAGRRMRFSVAPA